MKRLKRAVTILLSSCLLIADSWQTRDKWASANNNTLDSEQPFERSDVVKADVEADAGTDATVEAVVAHLEGVMDTVEQANRNSNFVGVQMTTCRIEVVETETTASVTNGVYLYQEQALVESLSSPYRQRFLQIAPGNNRRVDSHSFKPDSPEALIGLCQQPSPRSISAADLGEQVCTVSLRTSAIGGFVGSTPAGGCIASVRGAVSITNVVVLHDAGMDTWDRGFDAAGIQVWGADTIPYQYRWRSAR